MPAVGAALETTGKLTDDDLDAIAAYLKSLPPVGNIVDRKPNDGD
jgi:cytochrome c553